MIGRCRDCRHGHGGECDQLREFGGVRVELRMLGDAYDADGDPMTAVELDVETRIKVPPTFGCVLFEPSDPAPVLLPVEKRCENPACNAQYFGQVCPDPIGVHRSTEPT